jgi:hypothetical protein
VFLCIAGVFGTRWYRKRQRAARNANRASTWAPGSDDEKPVAGALPLASLPVASKFIDSPYSEPPKYSDLLGDVPLSLSSTPTLPPTPRLVDGEHVRVITAFNRTLEDELGE